MDNQSYVIDDKRGKAWATPEAAVLWYQAQLDRLEAGWQPIATAPMDGTEVLVFFEIASVEIVHLAWYRSAKEWEESGKLCGGWDSLEEWEGWWTYPKHSVTQEKLDGVRSPTHWAPYKSPNAA